jgi:CheY-like chemotaxis protein
LVTFTVRDTGIGIAPEHHEAIFHEFTQVENRLQSRAKGTGLGLPLSRRLAELLGGGIRVESEIGRGSTFRVEIPALAPGADPVPPAPAERPESTARILLIDDDEADRYVMRQTLQRPGIEIIEVRDGAEGVKSVRRLRPDLVFLDLRMPGLDGFSVLADLAAGADTSGVPVVVATSSFLTAAERARLSAARAVISKGELSRDLVSELLEAILPRSRMS